MPKHKFRGGAVKLRPLTDRQKLFAEKYLLSMNAAEAAIAAGYKTKRPNEIGHEIKNKPHVAAYIAERLEKRMERCAVDADYVLNRLVDEVEADMADLYDDENNLLPIKQWPKIWRQGLVAGMEVNELFSGEGKSKKQIGYTTKLKLSDRASRLVSIGKHVDVQAFKDSIEVSVSPEYAERLDAAIARKAQLAKERQAAA